MQRIRKGVYLLEAGGPVNAFLLEGPRGLTLVDTATEAAAPALLAEIEGGGFALSDLEQIILTHRHAGHAGGASVVLARRRVKVFAHAAEIPALTGAVEPPKTWTEKLGRRLWPRRPPFRPLEVVVALTQGQPLRALPHWQVLHTPGHTPGSISLYQPVDRVVICGDALSNRNGTLAAPDSRRCDDPLVALASVQALARLPCEVLCCGHGPVIKSAADRAIEGLAQSL